MAEKNCLNCGSFAWWDGDYCCTKRMKILCESPNGDFTDDILLSLEVNKDCKKHTGQENESIVNMYKEIFDRFLENKK